MQSLTWKTLADGLEFLHLSMVADVSTDIMNQYIGNFFTIILRSRLLFINHQLSNT